MSVTNSCFDVLYWVFHLLKWLVCYLSPCRARATPGHIPQPGRDQGHHGAEVCRVSGMSTLMLLESAASPLRCLTHPCRERRRAPCQQRVSDSGSVGGTTWSRAPAAGVSARPPPPEWRDGASVWDHPTDTHCEDQLQRDPFCFVCFYNLTS